MPRSPSPPPRGGYGRSTYRDVSPPRRRNSYRERDWERDDSRYRPEGPRYGRGYDQRDRPAGDGHWKERDRYHGGGSGGGGGRGGWGGYRRGDDRPRGGPGPGSGSHYRAEPDYDRRSPPRRSYSASSRDADPSPSKSGSGTNQVSRSRSGTPEEGQITSPLPLTKEAGGRSLPPVRAPRSPVDRRRSRSPMGYRSYDRDRMDRDRDWRDRDRDRERDRERDWEMDRNRARERDGPLGGSSYRRSRSPLSPPPRRRRSPSLSTISTRSPSSRPSPVKRPITPSPADDRRSRSPEKRPRVASPPPRTTLVPAPRPPTQPAALREPPSGPRIPPSAPRSERMPLAIPPTGPRALAHLNTPVLARPSGFTRVNLYSHQPQAAPPPAAPAAVKVEPASSPNAVAASLPDVTNNYTRAPPTGPSRDTSAPRLSWSERKSFASPGTSSPNTAAAPEPSPARAVPVPVPFASAKPVNPYLVGVQPRRPAEASHAGSSPYTGSTEEDSAVEMVKSPLQTFAPAQEPAAPPPPPPPAPATVAGPVSVAVQQGPREEELAELRAKEEEARIINELPLLRINHGGAAWEQELANHYHRMTGLSNATLRAQAAARHAASMLADAEAERIAADERRTICEAQLVAGSLGGVGIIPV
ncbi:hypothetical protein IAU60_002856 [Kwoniella sp. DSM 27419]